MTIILCATFGLLLLSTASGAVLADCTHHCMTDSDCPVLTLCKTVGCGRACLANAFTHPCQPVLCAIFCVNGLKLDEHQCATCSCN